MNGNKKELIGQLEEHLKKNRLKIMAAAEELRNRPMPEPTEELFALYEQNGNRLKYEEVYFTRRKYLAVYGMAAILEGKEQDIAILSQVIEQICAEECWALPAHVNRKEDSGWRRTVDLFSSETAQTLAEICDALSGRLPEHITSLAREHIFKRVLDPYYSSRPPYLRWEAWENNWVAVCAGSIGSASIYLMKEEPERLEKCLERICAAMDRYIGGFTEEGVCMEGLAYFTYGMTYFTGFAKQAFDYSGGRIDLLSREKCEKIAQFQQKCYFREGRTVSFSDGSSRDTFKVGLTCFLAMRYPGAIVPNMDRAADYDGDSCFRFMAIHRDFIWTRDYIEFLKRSAQDQELREEEKGGQITFQGAQWTICQSKNNCGMAAKGGNNDEPHNHNDIGSFLYLKGKEFLLTDLGCGEYTKDYFGSGRYEILNNRSKGHSVPIINGREQCAGAQYQCDAFRSDGCGNTRISYAAAYGQGAVSSAVRELEFSLDDGSMKVRDSFEFPDENGVVEENLITEYEPAVTGGKIVIAGGGQSCSIEIEGNPQIHVTAQAYSDHGGIMQKAYLIRWDVPVRGKKAECSFKVL